MKILQFAMQSFIKENAVLIAGIVLPLFLTFIFYISTLLVNITTDPPQYSVLYTTQYSTYDEYPYDFSVGPEKGLKLVYKSRKKNSNRNRYRHKRTPQLYLYNPKNKETKKIEIPDFNKDQNFTYQFPALKNKKISKKQNSPDGYRFDNTYRYQSGNLMTELFGGNRSRSENVLIKESRIISIPEPQHWQGHFIGWIIE